MLTPNALRGEFYNSERWAKCPSYSKCPSCPLCQNFSSYNPQCVVCENRKLPMVTCTCTDSTKYIVRTFEALTKTPFFGGESAGKVDVADIATEERFNETQKELMEHYHQLAGVQVKHDG